MRMVCISLVLVIILGAASESEIAGEASPPPSSDDAGGASGPSPSAGQEDPIEDRLRAAREANARRAARTIMKAAAAIQANTTATLGEIRSEVEEKHKNYSSAWNSSVRSTILTTRNATKMYGDLQSSAAYMEAAAIHYPEQERRFPLRDPLPTKAANATLRGSGSSGGASLSGSEAGSKAVTGRSAEKEPGRGSTASRADQDWGWRNPTLRNAKWTYDKDDVSSGNAGPVVSKVTGSISDMNLKAAQTEAAARNIAANHERRAAYMDLLRQDNARDSSADLFYSEGDHRYDKDQVASTAFHQHR